MSEKILLVDDETKLLISVRDYLKNEGYEVFTASLGEEALRLFKTVNPDFVVLDLMIPDISGETICKTIRKESDIPVLMLTAKTEVEDRINGLALGADDYLTKPFSNRELVMRIKAILRRTKGKVNKTQILSFNNGDLKIDTEQFLVTKKDSEISLTPNEYKILVALAQNSGRVFSREQLINAALGYDYIGYNRTIDSHIKNIRQKIENDHKNPKYIITVYGIGYKFSGEQHD